MHKDIPSYRYKNMDEKINYTRTTKMIKRFIRQIYVFIRSPDSGPSEISVAE